MRAEFEAGGESLVKLQQSWEQVRQRQFAARECYTHLTKLRMRVQAIDAEGKPGYKELVRKFCGNLSEPARTVIAKKRITDPDLTLPQLVHLAELEDRSSALFRKFSFTPKQAPVSGTTGDGKHCFFCKKAGHWPSECRKMAARKAAGTWEERERPKK